MSKGRRWLDRFRRRIKLYQAGLKDSAVLVVTLLVLSILGGLLTFWEPVASSGYWINVAAAPPFALLVILFGEVPLSIRASLSRCRNYRETIRRSASSALDLLWLLERDWDVHPNFGEEERGVNEDVEWQDLSSVRITGDAPIMSTETYSTYLRILGGESEEPEELAPEDSVNSASFESIRTFVVFSRLREDLANLAVAIRGLDQEPGALLSGPADALLRSTADTAATFIAALARDDVDYKMRTRAATLLKNIVDLLEQVDASLPEWAMPRFSRPLS